MTMVAEFAEAAPLPALAPHGSPDNSPADGRPVPGARRISIKASPRFGLYYTPDSDLYHDTLAEIWLSSEEAALANGFVKAD